MTTINKEKPKIESVEPQTNESFIYGNKINLLDVPFEGRNSSMNKDSTEGNNHGYSVSGVSQQTKSRANQSITDSRVATNDEETEEPPVVAKQNPLIVT